MSATQAASPHARPAGDRKVAALALLAFAMLIVSLDQYIVVVALPEIGRDLGYSAQTLQSVISAYAVASAGFLLLGGRAADLLGPRRVLRRRASRSTPARSLAGGLAPTPEVLLVARAVQGLGGALVFPATLALINTTFPEGRGAQPRGGGLGRRRRGRPRDRRAARRRAHPGARLGGGVLRQRAAGRPSPLLLAFALIPADRPRERGPQVRPARCARAPRSASRCSSSPSCRARTSAGRRPAILGRARRRACSLLAAFAAIERRSRDPLVPPRLLANRNLATAAAIAFLFWATFGSVLYFLTLYFQDVRGYDALRDRRRLPAPDRGRGRRLGARRPGGDALGPAAHAGRRARHRRARRAGARPGDVARRLLRRR